MNFMVETIYIYIYIFRFYLERSIWRELVSNELEFRLLLINWSAVYQDDTMVISIPWRLVRGKSKRAISNIDNNNDTIILVFHD